jgi:hypothetical protein
MKCHYRFSSLILMFPAVLFLFAQDPFKNPSLPLEQRVDNIISLLTPAEKIELLSGDKMTIYRLGVTKPGSIEALHAASFGGPADWSHPIIPTTHFQQAYGLAEKVGGTFKKQRQHTAFRQKRP